MHKVYSTPAVTSFRNNLIDQTRQGRFRATETQTLELGIIDEHTKPINEQLRMTEGGLSAYGPS